ncbi:Uncharacterised protein [Acinetobacter baumannii]|nr:Uncharacterised protein [Acinetobacter baumannii]
MQELFHMKEFFTLTLHHFSNRNTCCSTNDFGNFIFSYFCTNEFWLFVFFSNFILFKLFLQLWNYTILQTCCFCQIAFALSFFKSNTCFIKFNLSLFSAFYQCFLSFPHFFQIVVFFLDFSNLFFKMSNFGLTACVFIFFHRFQLHFQLD